MDLIIPSYMHLISIIDQMKKNTVRSASHKCPNVDSFRGTSMLCVRTCGSCCFSCCLCGSEARTSPYSYHTTHPPCDPTTLKRILTEYKMWKLFFRTNSRTAAAEERQRDTEATRAPEYANNIVRNYEHASGVVKFHTQRSIGRKFVRAPSMSTPSACVSLNIKRITCASRACPPPPLAHSPYWSPEPSCPGKFNL